MFNINNNEVCCEHQDYNLVRETDNTLYWECLACHQLSKEYVGMIGFLIDLGFTEVMEMKPGKLYLTAEGWIKIELTEAESHDLYTYSLKPFHRTNFHEFRHQLIKDTSHKMYSMFNR